jgi:Domain of Unknown Function (DUF1206)
VRDSADALIRLGYLAKALVYVLVGALALRVAAGLHGGHLTDPTGALRVILRSPFGTILLWLIGIGLVAYSVWRIVGVFAGWRPHADGVFDKALVLIRSVVYLAIGWEAIELALGHFDSSSSTGALVARALTWPLGKWMVIASAIGIGWYGIVEIMDAFRGRLEDELEAPTLRSRAGAWAVNAARAGIGARGVVLVLFGYALLRAGVAHNPNHASNLGVSFSLLTLLPHGTLMMAVIAAGVIAYGVYQLLHVRYGQT